MLIFVSVGLLLELKNNILRIYDLIKTTWMFQNNLHVEKKKKKWTVSSPATGNSCGGSTPSFPFALKQEVFTWQGFCSAEAGGVSEQGSLGQS